MSLVDQVASRAPWRRRRSAAEPGVGDSAASGAAVEATTLEAMPEAHLDPSALADPQDRPDAPQPAAASGPDAPPSTPKRRSASGAGRTTGTRPRSPRSSTTRAAKPTHEPAPTAEPPAADPPRAARPAAEPARPAELLASTDLPGPFELPPAASRDVRVLLVEDVPQVVDRVRELLRSQAVYRLVAVTSDGRRAEDDVAEHRPDVVLVDTLLQGRVKGPAVIERLRRARQPLPCVAITLPDRPLEGAIAEKVDAVVTFPFGTFDLIRGIQGAVTAGATRNPTLASRIVAVFSAKGGVGKTTIALNLAVALKELGLRTALVDGSLQFGDVRRLLGAASDLPSIIDLPTDSVRSSDLAELMVVGPAGVEVLLAPPRLEQGELVTTRDLDKILDMLRRTYHAVVIDTPSSLGETTLAFLDAADVIMQVVTPETAALDITRLAAQAFAGIGYPERKLELLLNRAGSQAPVDRGDIRTTFGRDPDHTVSSDWELVAASNARGVPFLVADPEAAVSRDVRAVAARIAAVVGAAPRDAVVGRGRAGRG